jgi:hypothetical protein
MAKLRKVSTTTLAWNGINPSPGQQRQMKALDKASAGRV